ncbi:MAG TPA: hypothetical protein VF221_04380 [Chloroflexota bacterium]
MQRSRLRILPLAAIRPHEVADPSREARIERRLREDGVLRDPLMVGAISDMEDYVLLDGTNRRRALQSLELPFGLVQVVEYSDPNAVQLSTWCHSVRVPFPEIVEAARSVPGVVVSPLAELAAADALQSPGTIAVVLSKGQAAAISRASEYPYSRADQLRALVDLYEDRMTRLDCNPAEVEELAQTLCDPEREGATLVAFPPISRSQVVTMALRGTHIPAGITRHVILGGRALRVNVPLELLDGTRSLEEANQELQKHLAALQPRLYREPTILFDS